MRVTLPYVEQGDAGGVPVILLHGYSDSWRSFELLLGELPASVHAFAVTLRGHGDAERPASGYAVADHVADVIAFMDAAGLPAAVIAGHSAGSYVAQQIAADHPERVLGLVLIGAFHSFADNPAAAELREVILTFTDPVDPEFVQEFQASSAARPLPDGLLAGSVAESLKVPAHVWIEYFEGLLAAGVPSEDGKIRGPALILWGDQDPFCPRGDQDALVAAIPGAQLRVYEGTGHTPQWEEPERTARDIAAFALRAAEHEVAVP